MPSHTFTTAAPVVRQELMPPPGSTAVIIHFMVTAPAAGGNVRLAHLRTLNSVMHQSLPAEGRLPRESEIVELIVRNSVLTAGFSGYGGNKAKHPVKHMGSMPQSFPVTLTVPFTGREAVVAAGPFAATSDTDIAPNGQVLELVLGIQAHDKADLHPPYGFTFTWDDEHAVEWVGAKQPAGGDGVDPQVGPTPPTHPALPAGPFVPLPTFPGENPKLAAALALAQALGFINPTAEQLAAIQAVLALRGGK